MDFFGAKKFGGRKLMGGAGNTTLIITVVVIGIIAYLIYTKQISNPLNWFKKTDSFGETQVYGVGPTASSVSGSGTYGYAKALTYDNQRTPQSDLEGTLVTTAKNDDIAWQKAKLKEGLANLRLSENMTDPATAIGYAKAYPERMTDIDRDLLAKGVANAMYKAYDVPYATGMGATAFAKRNIQTEGLSNMTRPFVVGSNIGGLAIDPDQFKDMRIPKRSEGFVSPNMALGIRPTNLQSINPNIKDYGVSLGFQDPTQVDLKLKPAVPGEKFADLMYVKKKNMSYSSPSTVSNIGYTTDKIQYQATYEDANCPCERKVSDDSAQDAAYAQQYTDCLTANKCTIGKPIDAVYMLTDDEIAQLKQLSSKYSQPQMMTKETIDALLAKQKTTPLSETEMNQLSVAQTYYNAHKADLDLLEKLLNTAIVRLKTKQYITMEKVPFNACRTTPGLVTRDDSGKIVRVTKYVPANSCNWADYRSSVNSSINANSSGACDPVTNDCSIDAVLNNSSMASKSTR
jgi:hypothetical protein